MPTLRRITLTLALVVAGCSETPPVLPVAPPGVGAPDVGIVSSAKPSSSEKPAKAADVVEAAKRSVKSGDLVTAAEMLEDALKLEPAQREALRLLAIIDIHRGDELERPKRTPLHLRAAEVARQLRSSGELNPGEKSLYFEAMLRESRTYAVEGKKEKAIGSLTEAVSGGTARYEALRSEHELDALRTEPGFQKLMKEAEEAALAQARTLAKQRLESTKPFPFDFTLPGLDGKTVPLASFRGKVVVVDLWGTWCPPCRLEIPHLAELSRKYQGKGLQVVGINFERVRQDRVVETIKDFVKENAIPYPCLIGNDKITEQFAEFRGFPTTVFLDRTGKVRAMMEGFDPEVVAEIDAIVTTLLAEGSPASPPAQ